MEAFLPLWHLETRYHCLLVHLCYGLQTQAKKYLSRCFTIIIEAGPLISRRILAFFKIRLVFKCFPKHRCIGSGWDGVNFPHSRPHSAVLCIGSWKGVDNTPGFWRLLSSAPTASRLSLQHSPPHQWAGGGQDLGRGHSQDSWLKLTEGIFHTIWSSAQQ